MTSAMRWLTLLAAGPGALLGGWLGEHVGLRATLVFAGATSLVLVALTLRLPRIRSLRHLPQPEEESEALGAEAVVRDDLRDELRDALQGERAAKKRPPP